ncbi:hypothetical protein V2G26_019353 [Clonostachys chloroleuca]
MLPKKSEPPIGAFTAETPISCRPFNFARSPRNPCPSHTSTPPDYRHFVERTAADTTTKSFEAGQERTFR